MDVIDRYFRTLRVLLPKDQRDDIIRELSEEIRSQVADREASLGRPLTADEQAAIVGQLGHPLLTAARYRPTRYLIGPIVFPHYWLALKVVIGLMVGGHLIGALVLLSSGAATHTLGSTLGNAIGDILKVIGWLTALAAWMDLWLARSNVLKNWQPRPVTAGGTVAPAPEPSVARFILGVLVSAWWLAGLRMPSLFFGPGASNLDWGPAMDRMYPVLVVSQLALLVDQFARLRARDAAVVRALTRVVGMVGGWALVYLVVTSDHQWMVWQVPAGAPISTGGRGPQVVQLVNYIWSAIFGIVAVLCIASTVKALIRRRRAPRTPAYAVVAALALFQPVTAGIDAQPLAAAPKAALTDDEIRSILAERIDRQQQSLGIVVGVVTPAGRRVVAHGVSGRDDRRPVTKDTVFEIGSVTKVLTAWLLADMSRRGEVRLSDPVSNYLPSEMRMKPASDGRVIRLVDLATHTAGLPFWPANLAKTGDQTEALASYTVPQLFDFIATFEVPAEVGSKWAYSNIDAGLLGVLLARRADSTYEALLQSRLTGGMSMTSTQVVIGPGIAGRLASGHDARLQPARRWNVPAMEGGGSLHSTVNDLLTFLGALAPDGPAAAALPVMLATRRPGPGFQQALGWMVLARNDASELLFHDGQTLGFASAIAYEPATRTGVVVLANAANPIGDIARHVLRPALPLAKPLPPAPSRTEIQMDPKHFDRLAGDYAPAPGTLFVVSREGDALMLQLPGLPKLRLRPESEHGFFVAENPRISVSFAVNDRGQSHALVFKAPGADVTAARVEK